MNCIEVLGNDMKTVGQKVLEMEDLIDIALKSVRRSKSEELETLVKLKGTLMESGEGCSAEIQARIDLLKMELK